MIDLHCHILPGIDDGPADMAGALALARGQVAAGVRQVTATPHVTWDLHLTAERVRAAIDELNRVLRDEEIDLEVLQGAEIGMSIAPDLSDEELAGLSLGGGPWILVEPPLTPSAGGFDAILDHLQTRGHRILLAHPERCPAFQREPARLEGLVHAGVLTSVTAGALAGRFGATVGRFAHRLVADGLVHSIASDAHDAKRRPPGMLQELLDAGYADRADWWCSDVPAAVLSGGPLPPAPRVAPAEPPSRLRRFKRARRAGRRGAATG